MIVPRVPAIADSTRRQISRRVRLACIATFVAAAFFPPYVSKATLAPQETVVSQQQFLLVEEGFLMKSSSLTDQGARRAYTQGHVHVVKEGDTLEGLAKRYEISLNTLKWVNDINDQSVLRPGDELIILPVDGVLHTVKRGQTLLQIAELYGIESGTIEEQNNVQGGYLVAGQSVIIPGGTPIVTHKPVTIAVVPSKPSTGTSEKPDEIGLPNPPVVSPPSGQMMTMEEDETTGVLQKPCSSSCFITQYFGNSHYALDMQERGGGPIFAAEAGTILRAEYGWNGGFGNVIEIDHGNELVTLYAHNKKLYVQVGDVVARGQKIAEMGNTGLVHGPTGIHIHFEVRLKGVKKNPLVYIQ